MNKNLKEKIYAYIEEVDKTASGNWSEEDIVKMAEHFYMLGRKEDGIDIASGGEKATHFYVMKNGRCVSDYDNKEEALKHARKIGGQLAYEV